MGEPQGQQSNKSEYSNYDPHNFKEFESPDITAWKLARAAIEHENILVNHRLTWLLTSQAFLFTIFSGLFVALEREEMKAVRPLIPIFMLGTGFLGIYICLVIWNGLSRARTALDNITKHYYRVVKDSFDACNEEDQEIPSTRTPPLHYWKFRYKYFDQFHLPKAMVIVWVILLVSFETYSIPVTREWIGKIGVRDALEILGVFIILALIVKDKVKRN
jgi:hypothetical protein